MQRLMHGAAVCAVLLFAFDGSASAQATSDSAILALMRARVDSGKNPAIVAAILENGRSRVLVYGKSGAPTGTLDGNTLFEIGSITKVFTSTLLAEMARRGDVRLDDPVSKHLPSSVKVPSRDGRQITLADLSMQQSGLPSLPDNIHPADPANFYADYTVEQLYEYLSRYQLTRPVGERFEYSNVGVGLLGHALSLAAGKNYETLVTERLLQPLRMTDTRITLSASDKQRLALGHGPDGSPAKNWDIPTLAGAGALRSTANDLLKFAAAAMASSGPLAPAFAEAQRPRRVASVDGSNRVGLNWFTMSTGPIDILWHNGGTGGYRSFLGLDKAHRRAVIMLTNSQNGVDDIGRRILFDAAAPPQTYSYITRVGRDTLSAERLVRFADHIESDVVFRNPSAARVRIVARFAKGDTIGSFELATRPATASPSSVPAYERLSAIRDTAVYANVKRNGQLDTAMSGSFLVRRGAMPFVSGSVAFYDHAMRQATRAHTDSASYDEFGAESKTPAFPGFVVRRSSSESIVSYGGVPLYAQIDSDGGIVRLDAREATLKSVTELVASVDIDAIAKAWSDRKPARLPSPPQGRP